MHVGDGRSPDGGARGGPGPERGGGPGGTSEDYNTIYYTILYNTVLYCTILHYTILYYTLLYFTRLD